MKLWKLLLPVGGMLALCGCSGSDLLNLTIPSNGYSVQRDIAYGANPRQHLDIYMPDKADPAKPVMVFFYGGSWQTGKKEDYLFVGQAFASRGYITVIADYRLYPEVRFPAFMNDAAHAVAWVHANIAQYGGNPEHIFLSGHSAGGYIAVMLTLNEQYMKHAGGKRAWIKGTIGIAGPYDFLPFTDPEIKALFGSAPDEDTQPINFVSTGLPPMLLVTGDKDTNVLPRNTLRLTAKLHAYSDPVIEKSYPGLAHIGIVLSLARGFRGKAPLLEDIDSFVHQQLK